MGSITSKQWFQIVSGIISGLITGAALMQTLFGQDLTIKIVAGLGIANIILSSVGATLSGPDSPATQIKNVAALPGVEQIRVNASATNGVAAAAIDPAQPKVGAITPEVRAALIAKSAA
jgi:hypothetical protein